MRSVRGLVRWACGALLLLGCGTEIPPPQPHVAPAGTPRPEELPDTATPPPLTGATLLVTRDGSRAVVSDPDTDRVLVVNLTVARVTATLALQPGDEPGRLVEDGDGRVHVALRGGGAVQTVHVAAGTLGPRRPVCPLPRGIAWDRATDQLHVACLDGELVTFPAAGGDAVQRVTLDRDLRDVLVVGNERFVTRFRAAETLVVDAAGAVVRRAPTSVATGQTAAVAWRAVADAAGGVWVLHQRTGNSPTQAVTVTTGTVNAYSQGRTVTVTGQQPCPGTAAISRPGVTLLRPPAAPFALPDLGDAALAVDLAVSPLGDALAVAVPGNFGSPRPQLMVLSNRMSTRCATLRDRDDPPSGQVVAVAWHPGGAVVAQTRSPATLFVQGSRVTIPLGGPVVRSAGHTMFHTNPGGAIACASCHPEGDDDGRTWTFAPAGPRRTMPLRGGLTEMAPYHWSGDLPDLPSLVSAVAVHNMGMPAPNGIVVGSLTRWLDALPVRPRVRGDATAAARGEAIFHDPVVACATCHSGPKLTNNQLVDVGTGEAFQVPTLLGLARRAPYMHDGCAPTLADRFGPCGGGDAHGRTSQLSAAQVADLVAYLETL